MSEREDITPEFLLAAYAQGYFPMARSETDDGLDWYYPRRRGVLSLETEFPISRSHKKLFRDHPYTLTLNQDFRGVMEQCRRNRKGGCWISDRLIDLYTQTQELGFAQSVECWKDGVLTGGVYGISLGGVFFAESMFSRETGASKVALISLQRALRRAGYVLLDVQYVNEHLKQFGAVEISRDSYLQRLSNALAVVPQKLDIGVG